MKVRPYGQFRIVCHEFETDGDGHPTIPWLFVEYGGDR
jgi:hypothetical protein